MHSYHFSDIAAILRTVPLQQDGDPLITTLLTDSRKLQVAAGTVFFAINGPQRSAAGFIPDLYNSGVSCFITDKNFSREEAGRLPGANIIAVDDVLVALQTIAARHRHRFNYPVIGITGSNGKTIVKEWLFQLLADKYNIARSPKSYNSQVGVPLSVWNMSESHTLALIEAGISKAGEMEKLQQIIDPEIGVFTYVGDAHAEGFANVREKINEKLKLFSNSKMLVFCADDTLLTESVLTFKNTVNKDLALFGWSRNPGADLFISRTEKKEQGTLIFCRYKETDFDFIIPFTDEASIHNAVTCCCVMLQLGIAVNAIATHIYQLRPVEMRLELKEGINNCSVINDSYSADLNSLSIALDFLSQQQQHANRTVILSDLLQSGYEPGTLYKHIAGILSHRKLFRFIGIGPEISAHSEAFAAISNSTFFESTEAFLKQISSLHLRDETILLKGARVFRFEKISQVLEQKLHETVLEINLNALRNNLKQYGDLLNKGVKLMAMVKAFSYGSGTYEIASLLQHAAVDYLAVAYADEGVSLRKSGIRLPIMVMNTEKAGFRNIVDYKLQPELYSFGILEAFAMFLQQNHIEQYPVHIKLDTGMHRLGFLPEEIEILCSYLQEQSCFRVVSVFSHLAASDEPAHDAFTRQQAALLNKMAGQIERAVGYTVIRHIANTSAIHRHPEMQLDMVRLGIGLYGVDSGLKLQNVTTLKTTISQIKKVKKGETVGYSRKAVLNKDSDIAVVRIGYADGYPRVLGNGKGKMLLHGQLVPVVGNVCMDMTMLDITGVEAEEGDDVIVFGEKLPVSDVASWAGSIPYEMLTNISQRVKRIYYEE
ncbi:MAG: bifunctional UDP-N-acetylmuramoyl-tripeptide:D-alanyl-D-alanine ligase/alanine racemase [Ferruginibacter sp.]